MDRELLMQERVPWRRDRDRAFSEYRPDAVVVTGGRAALGAAWAAFRRGIPYFVLEQNVIPGRANRLMAWGARRIYSQFGEARRWFRGDFIHSGSPMRPLRRIPAPEARARFGLDPQTPTILVLGGSQGSERLNRLGPAVAEILGAPFQWLHVAGGRDVWPVYRGRACVTAFAADMGAVYSACDAAISRAGATAIHEIAHFGLPAILVPYPRAADDHQRANARVLAAAGAAVLMEEETLDERRVAAVLRSWNVEALRANVARFARPEAAASISRDIEDS
jgi:UDP-N-acetylglucosamine--N-acetylmuramyl-(pentapeptide) pyrophosphoryl-undecaprenol N-acetylglucosamine transferase